MTKNVTRLTIPQQAEVMKLLQEHCIKTPAGYAEFAAGWDDQKIADQIGVNLASVQYRRVQLIGRLQDKFTPPPTGDQNLLDLIAELDGRIARLERSKNQLEVNEKLEQRILAIEEGQAKFKAALEDWRERIETALLNHKRVIDKHLGKTPELPLTLKQHLKTTAAHVK